MSAIYAPLNAVKRSVAKTIIPSNVTLTTEQRNELIQLEEQWEISSSAPARNFQVNTTSNPGVHYFCVSKKFGLLSLTKNPNLSPEIVYLLVVQCWDDLGVSGQLGLLTTVYRKGNTGLFEFVFNKASQTYGEASLLQTISSELESADIRSLMFVFRRAGFCADMPVLSRKQVLDVASRRAAEINQWFIDHSDEDSEYAGLASLPFSWVAGMFGYEVP